MKPAARIRTMMETIRTFAEVGHEVAPLAKQLEKLEQELDAWKGHLPQVDDILVAGLKY